MADVLSMSLDEIITTNKKTVDRRQNKKARPAPYTTNSSRGGRKNPAPGRSSTSIASVSDKIVVSNLANSVTESDVKELFARIGPVKHVSLNYNAEGKSKGVANVIFAKHGDAVKATSEYNNRKLDDRPMKIEIMVNPDAPQIQALKNNKPAHPQRDGRDTQSRDNKPTRGRGGAKKGGRGKQPKEEVSVTDLDAQMDAYMNDVNMEDSHAALANALA